MLLQVKNFAFRYFHQPQPFLHCVNLTFRSGTLNLVVGPSGAGKSTLLYSLAGLFPHFANGSAAGWILYNHVPLSQIPADHLRKVVTMLFQNPNQQFVMRTVGAELTFILENLRVPADQIPLVIDQNLRRLGVERLRDRYLVTLSGGEKQRVALVGAIVMNTPVILLDEPFTNVDLESRQIILHELQRLKKKGRMIILVDHNPRECEAVADHLVLVKNRTARQISMTRLRGTMRQADQVRKTWPLPSGRLPVAFYLNSLSLIRSGKLLLKPSSLKLYRGAVTLLTGLNGSGKSTLLAALARVFPYRGTITYLGHNIHWISKRNYYRNVNLVFQNADNQFLQVTVQEELQLSWRRANHHYYSISNLRSWLRQTRLIEHMHQIVYSLSGGQKKALQIIEMLLMGAPVMLMDEPFQNLDQHLVRFFSQLLRSAVNHHWLTLIIVSHQFSGLMNLFDYHLKLRDLQLQYVKGL